MNAYRIFGLVGLIILFIISLISSFLYGASYSLVWFFILMVVGGLLTAILFRKEKQLPKNEDVEEGSAWIFLKNVFKKLMLFILIIYPLFSIPRFLAGTPLKTLLAGYVALIAAFGTLGLLTRLCIRRGYIKPAYMFTFPVHDATFILTFALAIIASIGAFALVFTILMMG